ncbi:MAG: hypothetical protein LBQ19_03210, partial [Synergistaceae bacterium]|nr:hypothetical protein [Synergistaceae bacterium]
EAANIIIDISRIVQPGVKGLVPMTYRATVRLDELERSFSSPLAFDILMNPQSHLDEIFDVYVIQKEIHQGERAGWYTRLVDGVLTPQRAVDLGILDISGGSALTMTLSYYVLDDAVLESFEQDGYLIVPDGENDRAVVDPIWLNMWTSASSAGNSSQGNGGYYGGSSGGGGCGGTNSIALFAVLILAASASLGWKGLPGKR